MSSALAPPMASPFFGLRLVLRGRRPERQRAGLVNPAPPRRRPRPRSTPPVTGALTDLPPGRRAARGERERWGPGSVGGGSRRAPALALAGDSAQRRWRREQQGAGRGSRHRARLGGAVSCEACHGIRQCVPAGRVSVVWFLTRRGRVGKNGISRFCRQRRFFVRRFIKWTFQFLHFLWGEG